jgi:hypothetical protein
MWFPVAYQIMKPVTINTRMLIIQGMSLVFIFFKGLVSKEFQRPLPLARQSSRPAP